MLMDIVTKLLIKFLDERVFDNSIRQYLRNGNVFTIVPFHTQEKVFLQLNDDNKYKDNLILRKLVWLSHQCYYPFLYGDDGEMQCNHCMIDFKRDSAESIEDKLEKIHMKKLQEEVTAAGGWDMWRGKTKGKTNESKNHQSST